MRSHQSSLFLQTLNRTTWRQRLLPPPRARTHTLQSGAGHFSGSRKCISICPVSKSQPQSLTVFRGSTSCPLGKIRASYPSPAEDDLASFIDFLAVLEHSSRLLRELQLPHHLWGSHRLQWAYQIVFFHFLFSHGIHSQQGYSPYFHSNESSGHFN